MPVFVGRTPLSAYRYLRSLAHVAVAAVAVPVAFVAPASTLSFVRINSIGLWDAPAQERDKNPAWAGNEKRE
jgi:hypothetical protein